MTAALPLVRRWFVETRRGWLGFAVGVGAISAFYLSFYSSIGQAKAEFINQLPEALRRAFNMQDIGSGAGWAQTTVLGLLGMILSAVAGITWGARAIAGDEESGTLELTLAHGVTRGQVYAERALAVLLQVLSLAATIGLVLVLVDGAVGLRIGVGHAAAGACMLFLLVAFHATLALGLGAATGSKGLALGVAVAVFALGYVADSVSRLSAATQWLRLVSPMHWAYADQPLRTGVSLLGAVSLLGGTVLFLVVGAVGLARRDV